MIIRNGVDDHKIGQVVLVRNVVSVPGDDIERAVTLLRFKEMAGVLVHNLVGHFEVFVVCCRSLEVPRVGQAVRT